jgi:hypothetical protein
MPRRKIHKLRTRLEILPAHALLINNKSDNNLLNKILEFSATIIGMETGSPLPDIFEPGYHPNHRSLFHSPILGLVSLKVGLDAFKNLRQYRDMRKILGIEQVSLQELLNVFLVGVSVAYLDHLIADAFTPKGLPLF